MQNQLDQYDPDLSVDKYQIVKLPRTSIIQSILPYTGDIHGNKNELTMLSDDDQLKIAPPVIELIENEVYGIDGQTDEMPKVRFQNKFEIVN